MNLKIQILAGNPVNSWFSAGSQISSTLFHRTSQLGNWKFLITCCCEKNHKYLKIHNYFNYRTCCEPGEITIECKSTSSKNFSNPFDKYNPKIQGYHLDKAHRLERKCPKGYIHHILGKDLFDRGHNPSHSTLYPDVLKIKTIIVMNQNL